MGLPTIGLGRNSFVKFPRDFVQVIMCPVLAVIWREVEVFSEGGCNRTGLRGVVGVAQQVWETA